MSGLVVRPARAGDLDAVAAVEASQPCSGGWSRAQFAAELGRTGSVFLVAEESGRAVGHLAAWLVGGEAQLHTIAVDPGRARRGAGRALLEALRSAARSAGCSRVALEVSERNAPARAFYAAAGGRVVGRRPKFYNDGADALLMDLPL